MVSKNGIQYDEEPSSIDEYTICNSREASLLSEISKLRTELVQALKAKEQYKKLWLDSLQIIISLNE